MVFFCCMVQMILVLHIDILRSDLYIPFNHTQLNDCIVCAPMIRSFSVFVPVLTLCASSVLLLL